MKGSTVLIVAGVAVLGVVLWSRQQAAIAAAANQPSPLAGLSDLFKRAYGAFTETPTDCTKLAPAAQADCLEKQKNASKVGSGLDLFLGAYEALK
jgi:hypothetical protein